jgi:GNAT superfamily N-acetyltransferase
MYLIEKDGRIAAWSHVNSTKLIALFVDPDYTCQGLGRQLMEHADRLVQSFGNQITYVGATFNAVGFYEKFGFFETNRDVIQKGEIAVPMVHMMRK